MIEIADYGARDAVRPMRLAFRSYAGCIRRD